MEVKSQYLSLVLLLGASLFNNLKAERFYNEKALKSDTLMNLIMNPGAEDFNGAYWDTHIEKGEVKRYDTIISHNGKGSLLLDMSEKPLFAEVNEFYSIWISQRIGAHQPNGPRRVDELGFLTLWTRPDRSILDSLAKGEGYFNIKIEEGSREKRYSLIYYRIPSSDTGFMKDTEKEKYIKLEKPKNREWNLFERNIRKDWESKGLPLDAMVGRITLEGRAILRKERTPNDTASRDKWYGERINIDDISLIGEKYFDPAVLWIEIPDQPNRPFHPKAGITNLGKMEYNTNILCEIFKDEKKVYGDNIVAFPKRGEEAEAIFKTFSGLEGLYELKISIEDSRDEDKANNTLQIDFYYKPVPGVREKELFNYPELRIRDSRVEYYLTWKARIRIDIYNSYGRLIERVDEIKNSGKHKLDLNDLSSGVYFIKFKIGNLKGIRKAILIH